MDCVEEDLNKLGFQDIDLLTCDCRSQESMEEADGG